MSEQNKKPRRVVNKASSGLRRPGANDSTRRRATRVTAGQDSDTRRDQPVESETVVEAGNAAVEEKNATVAETDTDAVVTDDKSAVTDETAAASGDAAATTATETVADEATVKQGVAVDAPTVRHSDVSDMPKVRRSPRLPSLGRTRASSWSMAIGLLVAAVVVTAFAVVAALRPGVEDSNKAFVDTQATQEVSAAGVNALKTIYSYDVKTIGGYKAAVHKVVTGKMLGDFDKFADTTVSAVQQAQSTATATPDPIGVTLLTDDRAELLVDLTVAATKDGVPQESASGPIVLRMQKVNGHWLASEIADR
ncbi:hypothetical protein [Nocardia alni]|uniref:hypothetical protein n=1 Tax=Nocardia alni TaxID=2815723 RepID=UPI001C2368B2|nr:hypothetical protein [Nocardia alni]